MKILGWGSLFLCHYHLNHKDNLPRFWPFSLFISLLASFFYPILSTHPQEQHLPFQRLQHFLNPFRIFNPSSLLSSSHPPPSPTVLISLLTQLGSLAHHSAHLHPCCLHYLIPVSICHACLAKSQLCLNSTPCLLSSQAPAIVWG